MSNQGGPAMIPNDRVANSFAKDDALSESRRIRGQSIGQATATLVIHFTPRSGSSWLSSLLEASSYLGTGLELFNPDFLHSIAQFYGARSLGEYVEMAKHFSARGGVLSFEVTSHQLAAVFRNPEDFFAMYRGCPSFWLIREDIVSQAVSLAKMVRMKIGHATQADPARRRAADESFDYDQQEILKWLQHILAAERLSELFFSEFDVSPTRLSYERMISTHPREIIAGFARAAGRPSPPDTLELNSAHEKIATQKNIEFANLFRRQNAAFLSEVEHERSAWVSKVVSFQAVD